jgi:hypothetical protein
MMVQQGQVFQPGAVTMASGCGRTATERAGVGRSAFNEAGSPRRLTRVTRSRGSSSGFDGRRASRADSRSTSWLRPTSRSTTSSR